MNNQGQAPPSIYYSLSGQIATAGPSSQVLMPRSTSDTPFEDEYDYGGDADAEVDESIFRDMTFDEVLEDLNARFLVNLPEEERSLVRLYWQAEQAHWFYEDYLRPLNPHLPSLGQRHFTQLIIASSPVFASLAGPGGIDYDAVWTAYMNYKSMVPCCGGILLNQDGTKCLVVRGWKSNAGWSFPRGKININEPEIDCAIREVEEETGFDLAGRINERDQIQTQISSQLVTMFIAPGIDESTVFEAQTRKEIGAIEWVKVTDLPTWSGRKPKKTGPKDKKFYNVTPFVGPLKKWLQQNGYNPNPSAKKKQPQFLNQPQSRNQPNQQHLSQHNHRNLQPFFDDRPLAPQALQIPSRTVSNSQSEGTSALDSLFDKFITKQEEDIRAGTTEAVAGPNQAEGLQRLFGKLGVSGETTPEGRDRQAREDEDLAMLLGSGPVGQPAPNEKANRLLSLLKAAPAKPDPPAPIPARQESAPRTDDIASSMMKPHQASLLSMLSSASRAPPAQNGPSTNQRSLNLSAPTSTKPISLPTSPRPPSAEEQEISQRDRQRKLLEMTIAGMGLDSTAQSTHQSVQGGSEVFGEQEDISHLPTSYQQQSPAKQSESYPSSSYASHPGPPPHPHNFQSSPTKRHQHQQTSSTSSPTHPHPHNVPGIPPPPMDIGFGMYPSQQQSNPGFGQYRPPPGQHPRPPFPTAPAGPGGYGGHPRPPPGNPGFGQKGFQMGVPGQPGQTHPASNFGTSNFPSIPNHGHHNHHQSGVSISGMPNPVYALQIGHRPPPPPFPVLSQPAQYHQSGQSQGYPAQSAYPHQYQSAPVQNIQPGQQSYGHQNPVMQGNGQTRTQHVQNLQAVLQPVPVPRQASMGLLAMINGTGDGR